MVLFDIDGTLIRRAGPHHRRALVALGHGHASEFRGSSAGDDAARDLREIRQRLHREAVGRARDGTLVQSRQAFRRAAKSVHPDAGGSEEAFLELIAAQDVLMHPGAHKGE